MKCVSLETAKLLKEAGWNTPTEKCWISTNDYHEQEDWKLDEYSMWADYKPLAAPDVSELLEAMKTRDVEVMYRGMSVRWGAKAFINETSTHFHFDATNPAEALAMLYLELRKKNLV